MKDLFYRSIATIFAIIGTMTGGWIFASSTPEVSFIQAAIYIGVVVILAHHAPIDDQ